MASDDAGDGQDPRSKDVAPRDRDLHESLRERLEAIIPDLVRRTFTAGLGAVASTEDGLRRLTKELQIPNVAGYLADTADTTKDKVLEIIAREVREFLAQVKLSDEIAKLLTTLSFEVKTEIRFIPNSERYTGVEPDVKAAVRVKRAERERERPRTAEPEAPVAPSPRESVSRLRRMWRRATEPVRDAIEDAIDGDDPPAGR